MQLIPFNHIFGAQVFAVDCGAISSKNAASIKKWLHEYELLVFPDQSHLTPQQEVVFYKKIDTDACTVWRDQINNPWEIYKVEQGNHAGTYQIPEEPGVLVLGKGEIDHYGLKVKLGGSRDAYGEEDGSQVLGGGGLQWHIDGTFYDQEPCIYTQMRCIEAPSGDGRWIAYDDGSGDKLWCEAGATAFASGRQAYRLLNDEQKQRALNVRVHYLSHPFQKTYHLGNSSNGLRVIDSKNQQQDLCSQGTYDKRAKIYPLIWACPITKEKALMAHPRCMHYLENIQKQNSKSYDSKGSRDLLESLMRPGIDPEHIYVHNWKSGDLVIWHNRSVWHSATGRLKANDRRIMHLTAFNGTAPP